MARIARDPESIATESFDVIIVGGGIHGAMLLLEATRAGLRALLLERGDFGGATSSNHFRILHGGLRYLQSLDLRRFRESVREQRWFLQTFPDLMEPLRCVMPLYGEGLRRPSTMRLALAANDLLSTDRNRGVLPAHRLAPGTMIGAAEVRKLFPKVATQKLQGAAVWYDAVMLHSNRLLIEVILWACEYGAGAQNYVEVVDILKKDGVAVGVAAVDQETGKELEYRASVVINAAGPWSRNFGDRVDRDYPELFRESLAWNVLFKREPLGEGVLAIKPPGPQRQTYFMGARSGRLFVGTGHGVCDSIEENPSPTEAQIDRFIQDLNEALPGLDLSTADIDRVFTGHMPVKQHGSVRLSDRPVFIDHGRRGGLGRLYSISGVKYTTARAVAERAIDYLRIHSLNSRKPVFAYDGPRNVRSDYRVSALSGRKHGVYEAIIREEAVQHLDDLVRRRTDLGDHPKKMLPLVDDIANLFEWSASRAEQEKDRLLKQLNLESVFS